jgi:poly(glycerol-phosphate) alpha-glucosyltransferase
MKIVHYSTSLSRSAGGLYYSVSGIARAQAQLGAEVTVVGGADEHFKDDRSGWGDVTVRPFPFRFGRYGLEPRIATALKELSPDIMHVHGIWSAASAYGRLALSHGVSVVVSPRGMLDPWILSRRPAVKMLHSALFERPLLKRSHVHALNESERASVAAFMPDVAERIFVLPNGIEEVAHPVVVAQRSGTLYLGRVHSKKQTLELIRAWASLPATERLIVAGWGERAYEQQVSLAAAAQQNVGFVGSLYGEAKAEVLGAARFFILPSLSEGLPMAVLEALQHGCVPIITDACNLPELFRDGIAVRMKSDFSDFGEVMARTLAMSESEFEARSAASRQYSRRYQWSEIGQAMLDQYETILAAKGPPK